MTKTDEEFLESIKPEADEPVLCQVLEHTGELWQIGQPIPGDPPIDPNTKKPTGAPQTKIIRLVEQEDMSVDAYSLPLIGTSNDQEKRAFIHNVRPMAIKRTTTAARFDVWKDLLEEAVLDAGDEPPDDTSVDTTVPFASEAAMPVSPNGSAS